MMEEWMEGIGICFVSILLGSFCFSSCFVVATEQEANGGVSSGAPALACIGCDNDAFFSLGVTKGTKGGGGAPGFAAIPNKKGSNFELEVFHLCIK